MSAATGARRSARVASIPATVKLKARNGVRKAPTAEPSRRRAPPVARSRNLKDSARSRLMTPSSEDEGSARSSEDNGAQTEDSDEKLARKKWNSWSAHATSSPFPDFAHPARRECEEAYRVLYEMHNDAVEEEFKDPNVPDTIPHVLDAIIIAVLSQATSWSNAKRAMDSMKDTYGSIFAYDKILHGGRDKLEATLRCGGLHVRKSKIITTILEDVQTRHGKWDLDYLFKLNDQDAMKELISYKYIGPKSAFVVMGWCLSRNNFTVDTHIYRIAGLWGWRPKQASREQTQAHLDALVPPEIKFKLHFLLLQHGRACPGCRGGSKQTHACEARKQMSV